MVDCTMVELYRGTILPWYTMVLFHKGCGTLLIVTLLKVNFILTDVTELQLFNA